MIFWATLEAADTPFDEALDVILRYYGVNGKILEFVVERDCYQGFIKQYTTHFRLNGKYVMMGQERLHLKVLGREIGQYEVDGLQGNYHFTNRRLSSIRGYFRQSRKNFDAWFCFIESVTYFI